MMFRRDQYFSISKIHVTSSKPDLVRIFKIECKYANRSCQKDQIQNKSDEVAVAEVVAGKKKAAYNELPESSRGDAGDLVGAPDPEELGQKARY